MKKLKQTPSQTIGPYFAYGITPEQYNFDHKQVGENVLYPNNTEDERITIIGQIFDGEGKAIDDALIELRQDNSPEGFARMGTGTEADNRFIFSTIKPKVTEDTAPHINVIVLMRGLLNHVFTRLYFPDEVNSNAIDAILNKVPKERQQTLIAKREIINGVITYRFNIYMQGNYETVFLMHNIFSKYLSDSDFVELCSDKTFIQKMIAVEIALAKAQAQLVIIPKPEAEEITRVLSDILIDVEILSVSVLQNGIPTIGLLAQAKQQLTPKAADYLHFGITSQDVTDTALVLILKDVLTEVNRLLKTIISNFSSLSEKHKNTYLSARTRNQMAVPISFSTKVNSWKQPLERYLSKVEYLKNSLPLQLAGTDGNLSVIGKPAEAMVKEVAQQLDLQVANGWHSQRDGLTEISDALSGLCATIGKIGADVLSLSQTEVGELLENSLSGGSSSMPHKNNPVRSEALVALATYAIHVSAMLKQAQIHKNERDGIALSMEWLSWPKLIITVGTCLKHIHFLSENIQVNADMMKNNIHNQKGLMFSEKATFILAKHTGKTAAKRLVHQAIQLVINEDITFARALQNITPEFTIDWDFELNKILQ